MSAPLLLCLAALAQSPAAPAVQDPAAVQDSVEARMESLEAEQTQRDEELTLAKQEVAALQAQLEVERAQGAQLQGLQEELAGLRADVAAQDAREAAARANLASQARTLTGVAQRLERADGLLIEGSDEAAAELESARAELAAQLDGALPTGATHALMQRLSLAQAAMAQKDNGLARQYVWDAAWALRRATP